MPDPYDFGGIEFFGEGYFVFPDYEPDPKRTPESYGSPWEFWVATLARARKGDFKWVPLLLDLYLDSEDHVLKAQCANLLADAAPATTVSHIRELITAKLIREDDYDPQFAVDMSRVLFANKRLEDVLLLLSIYEDGAQFEDTQIIITYLEYLLGEIQLMGDVSHVQRDSEVVLRRYEKLLDQFGSDKVLVWLGELFSIVRFSEKWLKSMQTPDPITMRRTFEATTGIDCRSCFKDEEFQPLSAAAVVEEFLETPEADKYEEGVRYFFSHHIPD